jgi:hypothetical protein
VPIRSAMMLHKAQRSERMAESAGRYCPLCGGAAGLQDRVCRRCGESLQVPARDVGVPPPSTSSQEGPEEEAREGRETGSRRHWWRRLFGDERR